MEKPQLGDRKLKMRKVIIKKKAGGWSFDSSSNKNRETRDIALPLVQSMCPFSSSPNSSSDEKSTGDENRIIPTNVLQSEPETPFVVVNGYKLKTELAPLITGIYKKHGDIVKGSLFSNESRCSLLEIVCNIYKKLEASCFANVTHSELKLICEQIEDLQLVKVDVGWLRERVEWIRDSMETYRADRARSVALLCEKENAVEMQAKELEQVMTVVKKMQERLQHAKDERSAARSVVDELNSRNAKSLVNGLV